MQHAARQPTTGCKIAYNMLLGRLQHAARQPATCCKTACNMQNMYYVAVTHQLQYTHPHLVTLYIYTQYYYGGYLLHADANFQTNVTSTVRVAILDIHFRSPSNTMKFTAFFSIKVLY